MSLVHSFCVFHKLFELWCVQQSCVCVCVVPYLSNRKGGNTLINIFTQFSYYHHAHTRSPPSSSSSNFQNQKNGRRRDGSKHNRTAQAVGGGGTPVVIRVLAAMASNLRQGNLDSAGPPAAPTPARVTVTQQLLSLSGSWSAGVIQEEQKVGRRNLHAPLFSCRPSKRDTEMMYGT